MANESSETRITNPSRKVPLIVLCKHLMLQTNDNTNPTFLTVGPFLEGLWPQIESLVIHANIEEYTGTGSNLGIFVSVGSAYENDFDAALDHVILTAHSTGYKIAVAAPATLADLGLNGRFRVGVQGTGARFQISATAAVTLKT